MLSILNILKKHQQNKNNRVENPKPADSPSDSAGRNNNGEFKIESEIPENPVTVVSISSVGEEVLSLDKIERVKELYCQLFDCAKKLYTPGFIMDDGFKSQFLITVERALDASSSELRELLQLSLSDYQSLQDWLYCHAVNAAIISLDLGVALGYKRQQLLELCVASLLHDIGFVKCLEMINKNRRLTEEELFKIKEHPANGIEVLNSMGGEFMAGTVQVISQEHERLDGSGYPNGLRDNQINEYAQIVGLVDVYEAMTHSRPYRSKSSPPKAMNAILNRKSGFSTKILRIFLEEIGIFPVGTPVRLNTKESGVVYRENQGLPLRPRVMVTQDENGNKLASSKQIDLATNLLVCIEECLDASGDKAGL